MQRLFSTFADGWPGSGLLIQRLLVGLTLVYIDFACLSATPVCAVAVSNSIGVVAGLLLIAGLWTPIAGFLIVGAEGWNALSRASDVGFSVVVALLGLSLAMIGPGAWSVDALLYGRKRIAFPQRQPSMPHKW